MRSLILVLLLLNALFLSAQEATNNNLSFDNSLRTESEKLLTEWMDTFLTYQCDNLHPSLNGGVLCPACARMQTPDGLDGKRASSQWLVDERCTCLRLERYNSLRFHSSL